MIRTGAYPNRDSFSPPAPFLNGRFSRKKHQSRGKKITNFWASFVGFDQPKKRRPFSFPDIKKGVSVASPAGAACCTGRSVPPPVRRLRCKA